MVLLIIFVVNGNSQTNDKTITIQKKKYSQQGKVLTSGELKTLLSENPGSSAEYKKFKSNSNIGTPFLIAGSLAALGGAVLSFTSSAKQASDINNGKVSSSSTTGLSLALVIAGAGCVIVGAAFLLPANKHFKKAINAYNANVSGVTSKSVKLNLMVKSAGLGVRVAF